MTAKLHVAILTALVAFSIPAAAEAQSPPVDSLRHRVDVLERTTADLERRLRELESPSRREAAQARMMPATGNWREVQNWRRLRRGMTMDEVRALLGEPDKVDAMGGVSTYWRWDPLGSSAYVYFDGRSERLEGWSEPGR